MIFDKLYKIVNQEIRSCTKHSSTSTKDIHTRLINNPTIRDILEFDIPEIENISELLELTKGNVFAVRMDKMYGITGFKKPFIASLILKRLIESAKRGEINNKWIDAGNVNTALALGYYNKIFNGTSIFIVSRLFPDYIINYINEITNSELFLLKAPNLNLGIERDFYKHLVNLTRTNLEYKHFQPLWHAKYSGDYTRQLGIDLAEKISYSPDFIVMGLGAGANLEAIGIPIKTKFNNNPAIVIAEHSKSPLLNLQTDSMKVKLNEEILNNYPDSWFRIPPLGIPQSILGPHYDEINPLIKKEALEKIGFVCRYTDQQWKQLSFDCFNKGLKIGNSSAANLLVAKYLAQKGKTVITFIYEPFRSIYQGQNVSIAESDSKLNLRLKVS